MRRTHRRAYGPLIACMASVALLPVGTVARAQERTAQERTVQSIVDGVVNAVCQKQIVLLGEQPTHGEAHIFDAKSKIADRLIAQCGFTAILFEAPIYDFIGLERAAETRRSTTRAPNGTYERAPRCRAACTVAVQITTRLLAGSRSTYHTQVTPQGPGRPRAQSLTRRQNRWKPRRRANQPGRC